MERRRLVARRRTRKTTSAAAFSTTRRERDAPHPDTRQTDLRAIDPALASRARRQSREERCRCARCRPHAEQHQVEARARHETRGRPRGRRERRAELALVGRGCRGRVVLAADAVHLRLGHARDRAAARARSDSCSPRSSGGTARSSPQQTWYARPVDPAERSRRSRAGRRARSASSRPRARRRSARVAQVASRAACRRTPARGVHELGRAAEVCALTRRRGPSQLPPRRRSSTRPSGWPTRHDLSRPEEETGVDDAGHRRATPARAVAPVPDRRSARRAEQSSVTLPLSVNAGASPCRPDDRRRGRARRTRRRHETARRTGSPRAGSVRVSPSRVTSFSGPTRITCRRDAAATMRSRTRAPPQPFTRSRLGVTSSAPSTDEVEAPRRRRAR